MKSLAAILQKHKIGVRDLTQIKRMSYDDKFEKFSWVDDNCNYAICSSDIIDYYHGLTIEFDIIAFYPDYGFLVKRKSA